LGQCSIGPVKSRLVWIGGGLAVAGGALYRSLRRKPAPAGPDPRAEELRQRLDEARSVVQEREEFESAETPVDKADPGSPQERRRAVHEQGRAALDDMRSDSPE
jgi:hypothetical protein